MFGDFFSKKAKKGSLEELRRQGIDGKRVPFTPSVGTSWYSLSRRRNQVLVAGAVFVWTFSSPLGVMFRSMKYSVKYEIERYNFIKELDEEDRRMEQMEGHK